MTKRSIIAVAGTLLMACLQSGAACAGSDDGLTIARDGAALARIVLPSKASAAAGFAAAELRDYLSQVSGATFAITRVVPLESPRIFVGDCGEARAKGFDVGTLERDGFYRAVIDNDLYVLGRDDTDPRWELGGWAEFARKEHGTVNGVYDFLEDVCGVRWFMPGTASCRTSRTSCTRGRGRRGAADGRTPSTSGRSRSPRRGRNVWAQTW